MLPALLNPLVHDLDRVAMYGGVRCGPDDLRRFFAALHPLTPLEWYAEATVRTVQRLFSTSRVMLFPSYHEGLGIPLLEAQLLWLPGGHPAEVPPMDALMLGGAIPLPPLDARAAVEALRQAVLDDTFPHGALRTAAVERFRPERVAAVLRAAMGLDRPTTDDDAEEPAVTVPFAMAKTG